MLNQDRIRLMTQLAAYEQNEGKEYMPMSQYYRKDYVGLQMIKAFISSTIAFGIIVLLTMLYQLDSLEMKLYQAELGSYVFGIAMGFVIFTVVYQLIAWIVYSQRYKKAHKNQKLYQNRLKKVEKLHEREEKLFPVEDWDTQAF